MNKNRIHPVKVGKNVRMSYSNQNEILEMPNLIEVQKDSYRWFLEEGLKANGIDYEQIDSTMIQRIGDLEQDSVNWTVWWSVYVNGEYAQVGLWEQPVAGGDLIEIKLENTF